MAGCFGKRPDKLLPMHDRIILARKADKSFHNKCIASHSLLRYGPPIVRDGLFTQGSPIEVIDPTSFESTHEIVHD